MALAPPPDGLAARHRDARAVSLRVRPRPDCDRRAPVPPRAGARALGGLSPDRRPSPSRDPHKESPSLSAILMGCEPPTDPACGPPARPRPERRGPPAQRAAVRLLLA